MVYRHTLSSILDYGFSLHKTISVTLHEQSELYSEGRKSILRKHVLVVSFIGMSLWDDLRVQRMAQQVLHPVVAPTLGSQTFTRVAGLGVNQFQMLERLKQLRSWQEKQQEKLLQQQQQELIALRSQQQGTQTHLEEGGGKTSNTGSV